MWKEGQTPSRWEPGQRADSFTPARNGTPSWRSVQSNHWVPLLALEDTVIPHPQKQRPESFAKMRACWPSPPPLSSPGTWAGWVWGDGEDIAVLPSGSYQHQGRSCPCHFPLAVGGHRRWSHKPLFSRYQVPGGPGVLFCLPRATLSPATCSNHRGFPGGPNVQTVT